MAWIQVHQQLKDHRKLLAVSDDLDIEPAHMLGLLVSFWLWALDNAPSGSLAGISNRMITRAAQWNGDPDMFVNAMKHAGFLDESSSGTLAIHDWYEYAGKLIDQREAERNRSRRRRADAKNDQRTTAGQTTDDQRQTADRQQDNHTKTADSTQDSHGKTVGRLEKTRVDKSIYKNINISPNGDMSSEALPLSNDQTPYKEIVALYHEICKSYPTLRNVSSKRKKAIAARWKEYGHDLDTFRELFEIAEDSAFLKGKNNRNWTADFNWLMNSENMAKVLEGKYNTDLQPADRRTTAEPAKADTMDVLAGIIADEEGGGLFDQGRHSKTGGDCCHSLSQF